MNADKTKLVQSGSRRRSRWSLPHQRKPPRMRSWQPERLLLRGEVSAKKGKNKMDGRSRIAASPGRTRWGRRQRRKQCRLRPDWQAEACPTCYNRTTPMSIEAEQSKFTVDDLAAR